jgi:outer membrane protein TolC
MLMKKILIVLIVPLIAAGLCVSSSLGQAAESLIPAAGVASPSESKSVSTTGVSFDPLPPGDAPALIPAEKPAAMGNDAPGAKIEIMDPKAKKKQSRREQAEDKARTEALEAAMGQQVEAMREEREREMPYLDKVYIRTSITPLKMMQKDEFLNSGPKDLQDLILRAQSVHTQAKAAHENISLYNRRVLLAFRKLFPDASLNFNDRIGTAQDAPFTGKDWHVTLRQPIFNGGVLWNTLLQEKAQLQAAKKQYDKTLAELVYDLSRAYFEYQRTMQTAEENRAAVEKMKRFSDMSEEKFSQKIISEIEHLNVQSQYSQMQFDLESANQDFELAKIEIQKYLGLSVNDQFTLAKVYDLDAVIQGQAVPAGSVAGAKKLPDIFKGQGKAPELPKLIDLSYGNRPELQVEAAKLQAARLGERIKWGEFLPKANLTYKFGELGEAYTADGSKQALYDWQNVGYINKPQLKKEWQLMLEMNWNIGGNKVNYTFDRDYKAATIGSYGAYDSSFLRKNGMTVGVLDGLDAFVNVKQAEVDKLNQVVELENAEKKVLQDVKEAYYSYQKAVIQVNSTVKRLEYRKRVRDYAEYRMGKKEIELSEYMTAESELVSGKGELHKALKEYFSAKAALNHAVGIQDFFGMGESQKGSEPVAK